MQRIAFAANVMPIIKEIRGSGISTFAGIADATAIHKTVYVGQPT
jgi:hypothetical protein